MEIRILKYFLTVARELSISKAAESLHMPDNYYIINYM